MQELKGKGMRIKGVFVGLAVIFCAFGALSVCPYKSVTAPAECEAALGRAALDSMPYYTSSLEGKRLDSLEEYLVGVVAAEMPAAYDDEALKAQAVAARTYALREIEENPSVDYTALGQAYISQDTMKKRWGSRYDELYKKVSDAVTSTRGIVALYGGKPILAAFCASSGGKTEDSGNVWETGLPYLKSVDSHWDDVTETRKFTESELVSALGGVPEITERTQAGYVKYVTVDGRSLRGADVREKLNLKSACFSIERQGGSFYINTKGYGHGVGMSQTGAGQMAAEGADFEEILTHYYVGCEIGKIKK